MVAELAGGVETAGLAFTHDYYKESLLVGMLQKGSFALLVRYVKVIHANRKIGGIGFICCLPNYMRIVI